MPGDRADDPQDARVTGMVRRRRAELGHCVTLHTVSHWLLIRPGSKIEKKRLHVG